MSTLNPTILLLIIGFVVTAIFLTKRKKNSPPESLGDDAEVDKKHEVDPFYKSDKGE